MGCGVFISLVILSFMLGGDGMFVPFCIMYAVIIIIAIYIEIREHNNSKR